jgi:hypothetical protein
VFQVLFATFLATFGNIWQHLATFGIIWHHLATFGNIGNMDNKTSEIAGGACMLFTSMDTTQPDTTQPYQHHQLTFTHIHMQLSIYKQA